MKKGTTHSLESIEKNRKSNIGKIPWNKGKKGVQQNKFKGKKIPWIGHSKPHSEQTKEKIRIMKKLNPTRYWLGRKVSEETRKKLSESLKGRKSWNKGKKFPQLSGKNNPNWKGGITPLNQLIRHSLEYRLWREAVFERDDYTCIWCGAKNGNGKSIRLEADHIKPFAFYPELRFAIDNGRTLCKPCHDLTKWGRSTELNYKIKKNKYE